MVVPISYRLMPNVQKMVKYALKISLEKLHYFELVFIFLIYVIYLLKLT